MSQIAESGALRPGKEEQIRKTWVGEPPKLDGQVLLADYDPQWPPLYEREAARISSVLGEQVLLVEHIGSTSVPGLAGESPSSTSCWCWPIRPPRKVTSRAWSGPATGW
jgi:hypothetical protein